MPDGVGEAGDAQSTHRARTGTRWSREHPLAGWEREETGIKPSHVHHYNLQRGHNGGEQPRPPQPCIPTESLRWHQQPRGMEKPFAQLLPWRGEGDPDVLRHRSPPAAPTGTHHLSELGLQVSLLHAQLLVGLDHLLQLLLPLFALLQLPGRQAGVGSQLGDPPRPPAPPAPLTSCWNWLSCCCSDAFSLLSSDVSLAS